MSVTFLLPALLFIACDSGEEPEDSAVVDDGRGFDYFVNTTTPYNGDNTCMTGRVQNVDTAKQVMTPYNGEVHDFQTEDEVSDATVKFWLGDDIKGAVDAELTADANGSFSTTVPACTPIAYGTFTPAEWEETVDTYEVHQVYGYEEDGSIDGEWVNSVSVATSKIIPSVIGIDWDTSTGIIAGTAFDCLEQEIGNVQIFIRDADGKAPATGEVFYFDSNNLPTSKDKASATNVDNGLWVAVNVPVGTWTAEMYGYNGSTYDLLGSTVLEIKAGSVNISNIYTGLSDGIAYPPSCLAI